MIQKRKLLYAVILATLALYSLSGCGGTTVRYGDPGEVETMTLEFGSTDLQTIAEKMVQSLLVSQVLGDKRPVVYVSQVKNKTAEHIDTKSITDTISTALLKSGKVRFTAASEINKDLLEQLEYQENTGLVDPKTQKQLGKQVGADYMLYGEITSINKAAGRKKDVYYKITLKLADIQTGIIEWADEKEIRKGSQKSLLGM
ncbi:MAG: penicillin-binding protein activator LpoB [bacterium]